MKTVNACVRTCMYLTCVSSNGDSRRITCDGSIQCPTRDQVCSVCVCIRYTTERQLTGCYPCVQLLLMAMRRLLRPAMNTAILSGECDRTAPCVLESAVVVLFLLLPLVSIHYSSSGVTCFFFRILNSIIFFYRHCNIFVK